MKKILLMAFALCLATMAVTSCQKEEGNSGGGGTDTDPSNDHAYVDLGLSVKWATCNVGATNPEDYGDCYAWGETETKTYYGWSTYRYGSDWNNLTKYNTHSDYGTVDNKTTLDPEDDVAHVRWGGKWRMPTIDEIKELLDSCTWTWTVKNGVNGYEVKGKNGNTIFLPAAGYRSGSDLNYAGLYGVFWSSSLNMDYPGSAYYLYFYSGYQDWDYGYRCRGLSVRPVLPDSLSEWSGWRKWNRMEWIGGSSVKSTGTLQ